MCNSSLGKAHQPRSVDRGGEQGRGGWNRVVTVERMVADLGKGVDLEAVASAESKVHSWTRSPNPGPGRLAIAIGPLTLGKGFLPYQIR